MLLAVLFPRAHFLNNGKKVPFIFCLLMQLSLVGWLPAAIWATISLTEERHRLEVTELEVSINCDTAVRKKTSHERPAKEECQAADKIKYEKNRSVAEEVLM